MDIKSYICMAKNGKDTKQTRHISRRIHFARNGEERILQMTVWCEGGMQPVYTGTNTRREDEFNHGLKYLVVILDN